MLPYLGPMGMYLDGINVCPNIMSLTLRYRSSTLIPRSRSRGRPSARDTGPLPSAYLHFTALSPPSFLECVFDQSAEVRTAAAVDDMLAARKTETVMAAVCSLRCGGEGLEPSKIQVKYFAQDNTVSCLRRYVSNGFDCQVLALAA